mmetsp:Transcript_102912/g.300276  ORF Transcript_102912/g.300276 Transcript_102912/m.300276 type:complete len:198 (-) Transcript_102912:70-663(-)
MGSSCSSCCGPQHREPTVTFEQDANGLVTSQELVDAMARHQSGDRKGGEEKNVNINLDIIETILLTDDNSKMKRAADRKSTGFVSQEQLKGAVNRVSFNDSDSKHLGPHNERVKDRKGTGFVTKEHLLQMLDVDSEEEEEDENGPPAKVGAAPIQPAVVMQANSDGGGRSKARKGTGFVTKSKLKKVLAAAGEDESP